VPIGAALLFWFNPSVIWDDHCWPQWDVWVLPFFLFAVVAGLTEWWFLAGVLIGVGAMIKGQILLAGAGLVLWPLFQGRFGAAGKIIAGTIAGIAATGLCFVAEGELGRQWIWTGVVGAVAAGSIRSRKRAGLILGCAGVLPLIGGAIAVASRPGNMAW